MTIPSIPIWLVPWKARKAIYDLDAELVTVEARRAEASAALIAKKEELARLSLALEEEQKKTAAALAVPTPAAEPDPKTKRALGALLAWIYTTHKIDQRANTTGLTDILKDFPPIR